MIHLVVKVDIAASADVRAVYTRSHLDTIAEFIIHFEVQCPPHCLALIHCEGLVEQQTTLIPVCSRLVWCCG